MRILAGVGLLCAIVSAPDVAGQTQDASIIGQVTDESGGVLPGVTITVGSPALQVKQLVDVTNDRGEYRVTPLPIGLYSVEYSLPGFQTIRNEGVRLTTGFVARLDIVLKAGAIAESITVLGQSPVVDIKSTTAGTLVSREILESVPTGRNGLHSVLMLAAGSRPALDVGGVSTNDPFMRAFGRSNLAWVSVDGVSTTGPFPGGSAQSSTISYDTIEEASVQTVGSAADSPTSGIQLGVITKSGGNTFHGGGVIAQAADWMQSSNIDDALRAQGLTVNKVDERWDRSGELGGRIVRDKLWFYGTVRMRKEGVAVLGLFQPDGSPVINTLEQKFNVGKLSYQINQAQKLIGVNHWSTRDVVSGQDLTRFTAFESRGARQQRAHVRKLEWQLAQNDKFLSLQYGGWFAPSYINPSFSDNPGTFDQITQLITGANESSGIENNFGRHEVKGTFNWYKPNLFHGNHDFKTGFMYDIARGDINTYDLGKPGNVRLIYRDSVPFQISARNNPVTPRSRLDYMGMFVQDSWTINRRLTFNLGVRFARDHGWLPEQCREAAPAPLDTLYPAECYDEMHLKIWNTFAPRLHAAFDVTGNGRTLIKGGWGRFYTMRGNDDLNVANGNADISTVFRWTDRNGDKRFQAGEADLRSDGPDFVSRSVTDVGSLVGFVQNPDQKLPGSDEFSLSLEQQLMNNFALRVTGIYSKNFNTTRVLNMLRPYEAYNIPITNRDPGPDGRLDTTDDPGTTVTYFDYPAGLRGSAFQRPTFINDPESDADYKSYEIAASKRLSNRWQMLMSYSATKSNIPYTLASTANQKAVASVTFDPNAEIFAANRTWEWATRVTGSYFLPVGIQLSGNFENRSGEPWARTVSFAGGQQIQSITLRVEPVGTRRLPSVNMLSIAAEKAFRLPRGQRVSVRGQAFNVLNDNSVGTRLNPPVPALVTQSGGTFMRTTAITPPRIGEVHLTYAF